MKWQFNPPHKPMPHKKENLPSKSCLRCGRPFAWRKKWERDWDQVKYCSDRCRRQSKSSEIKEEPNRT
ncbi:MAG: DUF2256 domain-containing protein [Rubripirellula sp.]